MRLGRALVILAAPVLYFAAARRILPTSGRRLAVLALVLAGAYYAAARAAARIARGEPRVALLHRALALGFLALAPAVTLGPNHLVIVWSVVGLVLVVGGFAVGAPRLRAGGLAISGLAWARWFAALGENTGRAGTFLLAHPALPTTVAIAVTAVLGALVYRARERGEGPPLGHWERLVRPILLLVAIGSVALLVAAELDQYRTLAIPPPYVPRGRVWMWRDGAAGVGRAAHAGPLRRGSAALAPSERRWAARTGGHGSSRLSGRRSRTRASWPDASSWCSPGSTARWRRRSRTFPSARASGSGRWGPSAQPFCSSGT